MEAHQDSGLSSAATETEAGPSSSEQCSNEQCTSSLDDAVGKLLQGSLLFENYDDPFFLIRIKNISLLLALFLLLFFQSERDLKNSIGSCQILKILCGYGTGNFKNVNALYNTYSFQRMNEFAYYVDLTFEIK